MRTMLVERPGMFSTLQDTGRLGHQQYGVSVNGPMDEWSHRAANALVGNPEDAAVLECTLNGPRLSFSEHTLIALCGASMNVTADGQPVPYGQAVLLRRGVVLDIGARTAGARLYLAVRGGLAPEPVLGSRSTNVRAGFGGFHGRPLRKGDHVPLSAQRRTAPALPIERRMVQSGLPMLSALPVDVSPPARPAGLLRVIPGPHWQAFTAAARADFESRQYQVTPQSDRMGIRLQGPALKLEQPMELVSEATVFGTVQVPPDGQPIVLMADRQSAGGYPKIGYVASADLPLLAQAMPGDGLRFETVTQADAENAWRDFEERLQHLRHAAAQALES
ncbi:biotin-dependent carboxyltransferase family protein [Achromobacter veterisilvae]|uniref:Biotin-dependent carboxyltransferase family protein n=1 Tax=Achromobacter veterisilvae TaxID=2069367 RepID=A0ABZ2RWZ7_9BURK